MKKPGYHPIAISLVCAVLLSVLMVLPASAATRGTVFTQQAAGARAGGLAATVFLPTATLRSLFQSRVDQQVPVAMNGAMDGLVSKLPVGDRGWAMQMAHALIQPSATLIGLTPTTGGLVARIRLSLYPGDPHPIISSMLVTMSVLNSSTIQVSAHALPGSPALVSGPLATLHMPLGQLYSIQATPACGDAGLAINLSVPLALGQAQAATGTQFLARRALTITTDAAVQQRTAQRQSSQANMGTTGVYVVIPATSFSAMGNAIGSLPVSNNLTARNIQVAVQGSQLVITSNIYLGSSFKLGTATTYVQPLASGGGLAVHVVKTMLTILSLLTFPDNTYNRQIEQTLNSKLNGALGGKISVSDAALGYNNHVPCAGSDGLVLTGTTSLPS